MTTHAVYMGGSRGYYVGQKPALRPGLPEDSDHRFSDREEAQAFADALNARRPDQPTAA